MNTLIRIVQIIAEPLEEAAKLIVILAVLSFWLVIGYAFTGGAL